MAGNLQAKILLVTAGFLILIMVIFAYLMFSLYSNIGLMIIKKPPTLLSEVASAVKGTIWYCILLLLLGFLALIFTLGLLIKKLIVNRIETLSALTKRVSRGDFSSRMERAGSDEIGHLQASLDEMRQNLKRSMRETERRSTELSEKVEEKTKELRRVNEELAQTWQRRVESERMASLGRMAAAVAHEIRNPLNAIGLTVGHLQDEFLPEGREVRKKFAAFTDSIQNEIKMLGSLVKRFLEFSKPEKPKLEYEDLHQILDEVLLLTEKEASSQGIRVVKEYARPRLRTMVDKEKIKEAFLNIIVNAIQAMPQGGELRINSNLKIGSKLDPIGSMVQIGFTDTGCGIPEGNLKKLFDPYFTSKEDKGVGLGLAIARRIVEDHWGTIEVESQDGVGSTFNITLPMKGALSHEREERDTA